MGMSSVTIYESKEELAHESAEKAIAILQHSIDQTGHASWVLAGGSTPLAAYAAIASSFSSALDWTKVTLLLGDERIGDPQGEFNNWHAIMKVIGHLPARKLGPRSDMSAEEAAADYAGYLNILPKAANGLPQIDLLWLGVGDDGHTLSLFPNHPGLFPSSSLVVPIHDSPKPPRDRISLSLRSLQGVQNAMILASGAEKHDALEGALSGNNSPIALAVSIIETHEGTVSWHVDKSTGIR
jgi:6-phosphogluconolactonase